MSPLQISTRNTRRRGTGTTPEGAVGGTARRVVLFQRTLGPYRISLFNNLSEALDGRLTVLFTQAGAPRERRWTVAWADVAFDHQTLRSYEVSIKGKTRELSLGVGRVLDRVNAGSVLLAGWDVPACWAALRWCRKRSVPAHAWVESSARTGKWRGPPSTAARTLFLSRCESAIVPGVAAERFVRSLSPALPCVQVPNSIDSPELRDLASPPSNGALLFLGELSDRKGADLILSAADELLSVFPTLLVAGDGPLRSAFADKAREVPGFEYVGFVEGEVRARCMERSSVVLLPSRRDPWPLAACEALVARRPIVVGPGVGSYEDLRSVANGAVVRMDSEDASSLVSAAVAARAQSAPGALRTAFSPQTSAATMASRLVPQQ